MCHVHGYLLSLGTEMIHIHHGSDKSLSCSGMYRTFSTANNRIPFQNALSTLLRSPGESGTVGSRVSSIVIKTVPPSPSSPLSFPSSVCFWCYLHCQTTFVLMVTGWLPAALGLHSLSWKCCWRALLPSRSSKNPGPNLRVSLSYSPIPESVMAARQMEYSDWPGWVVSPPLSAGGGAQTQVKWELKIGGCPK